MKDIDNIIYKTHSRPGDVSINLDNQKCLIGHNQERLEHSRRTVYRVCWSDENTLVGSVLLQGSWEHYEFQEQTRTWTPAPKAPRAIPIDKLIDSAEKNLRDLTLQELHRLKVHYQGHKHHWRAFAVALELTYRYNDVQTLAKQIPVCPQCDDTFKIESASYLFRTGRARCPQCDVNVKPLYAEASEKRDDYDLDRQRHRTERRRADFEALKRRSE